MVPPVVGEALARRFHELGGDGQTERYDGTFATAEVFAVTGSADKLAFARDRGASFAGSVAEVAAELGRRLWPDGDSAPLVPMSRVMIQAIP